MRHTSATRKSKMDTLSWWTFCNRFGIMVQKIFIQDLQLIYIGISTGLKYDVSKTIIKIPMLSTSVGTVRKITIALLLRPRTSSLKAARIQNVLWRKLFVSHVYDYILQWDILARRLVTTVNILSLTRHQKLASAPEKIYHPLQRQNKIWRRIISISEQGIGSFVCVKAQEIDNPPGRTSKVCKYSSASSIAE